MTLCTTQASAIAMAGEAGWAAKTLEQDQIDGSLVICGW